MTYLSSVNILLTSLKALIRNSIKPQNSSYKEKEHRIKEKKNTGFKNTGFLAEDTMKKTWWICVCGMVIAALLPVSWQMILKDSMYKSRWQQSYKMKSTHSFISAIKHHSKGTFTSDFTEHVDNMKARYFVHWLINARHYSSTKRFVTENPIFLGYPPGSFWLRYN